jgi:hypothetical protein
VIKPPISRGPLGTLEPIPPIRERERPKFIGKFRRRSTDSYPDPVASRTGRRPNGRDVFGASRFYQDARVSAVEQLDGEESGPLIAAGYHRRATCGEG